MRLELALVCCQHLWYVVNIKEHVFKEIRNGDHHLTVEGRLGMPSKFGDTLHCLCPFSNSVSIASLL